MFPVGLSPLPLRRHSAAIAMTSSNWITEVDPPRGFPETPPPKLATSPKPHPGVSKESHVLLIEQRLDSYWRQPWFLVWPFEATINTASVEYSLNLNR